jgi:hypothetical protein
MRLTVNTNHLAFSEATFLVSRFASTPTLSLPSLNMWRPTGGYALTPRIPYNCAPCCIHSASRRRAPTLIKNDNAAKSLTWRCNRLRGKDLNL